jgi:Mrp family chromosome partitioning ATPase
MAYDISRLRLAALCLAVTLGLAYAVTTLSPQRYIATARALLPASPGLANRVLKIERTAEDPGTAAVLVSLALATHSNVTVIDEPIVLPEDRQLARNLTLGGLLGLVLGGVLVATRRRPRAVRNESALIASLGAPLLAARPLHDETLRPLCLQLLEHWFTPERTLLPVVSVGRGEGRSHLASQLAVAFSKLGVKTLLIDADLRAPGLHRLFGLRNRRGLSDFLAGGRVQLVAKGEHLAVLVAGQGRGHPLGLLGESRLGEFLAAAGRPFQVVLVDTPAARSGPDLQIFAAHAGGALVVVREGADAAELEALRRTLASCHACVVATLLKRD